MTEIKTQQEYIANGSTSLTLGSNVIDIEQGMRAVVCSVRRQGGVDVVSFSLPLYGIVATMTQVEFGQRFDEVESALPMIHVDLGVDEGSHTVTSTFEIDPDAPDLRHVVKTEKPKKKRGRKKKK